MNKALRQANEQLNRTGNSTIDLPNALATLVEQSVGSASTSAQAAQPASYSLEGALHAFLANGTSEPTPCALPASTADFANIVPDMPSLLTASSYPSLPLPLLAPPDAQTAALSNPLTLLSQACENQSYGTDSTIGATTGLSLKDLGIDRLDQSFSGLDFLCKPPSTHSSFGDQLSLPDASAYFQSNYRAKSELDDPDLDPINLGIVSEQEVEELFQFFYSHLQPISLVLDPAICSARGVRQMSPFLLTAVCAAASQFLPNGNAGMTTRLYRHYDHVRIVL